MRTPRCCAIAVAALALLARTPAQAAPFTDVSAADWARDAIRLLAADELLAGYPGGAFDGERPVTRTEFDLLLTRLQARLGAELAGTATRADLTALEDRLTALRAATDVLGRRVNRLGGNVPALRACALVNGYPGGGFAGQRPVTRAEMAAIAARVVAHVDAVLAETASQRDLDGARILLATTAVRLAQFDARVRRLEGRPATVEPAADLRPVNRNAAALEGTIVQLRFDAAAANALAKSELDRLQKHALALNAELDVLGVAIARLEGPPDPSGRRA